MNQRKATEVTDSYPLTPMQQGMLFQSVSGDIAGVDIEQVHFTCPRVMDTKLFQQSWENAVSRHAVLRTSFRWEGLEAPVQEVHEKVVIPFNEEDWSCYKSSDLDRVFEEFLENDRMNGFDLAEAPIARVIVARIHDGSFKCVWTFHHILLDGRSFSTVLNEVFELYHALVREEPIKHQVPPSFKDYIDWHERQDWKYSNDYWKGRLEGITASTEFRVDHSLRGEEQSVGQKHEKFARLTEEQTGKLRSCASEYGVTLNTLIQGAWAMLLNRYSGEEEVVFGTTRACRHSTIPSAKSVVGLFINTVPMRVTVPADEGLRFWIKKLRDQEFEIREYENTPLVEIQKLSDVPGGKPLFESLVMFDHASLDAVMRAEGTCGEFRDFELREKISYPLLLQAYGDDLLLLKIQYAYPRFDDATIERMLGHLQILLLRMSSVSQNLPIGSIDILTDKERDQILNKWNVIPQESSKDQCLHERFEKQAARRPNSVALTCDGKSLTYGELNALANRVAWKLRGLGVGSDILVGICMERENALVIGLLSILKAGGAYLPIDLAYPAERLAFMLADSQAPILLTQSKLKKDLPETRAKILCIDELLAKECPAAMEQNLPPLSNPDHLAYVIYTSGTTGKPKGSLNTHRNVDRLFTTTDHWFRFGEKDVWTLFHSYAFDFSVWELWGALLYGGRLVVVPYLVSRSPEAFYGLLVSEKVTVLNQTPSAFRQLMQAEDSLGQRDLALRYVVFGGEALEMQSLQPWFERHGDQTPQLVNMYGITETTVHVTYRPIGKNDLQSGSVIGVPIPDLQVYILDSQKQLLPIGVPGEMYVGGEGLARGYLNRPELTEERFIPDHLSGVSSRRLYRTGDLARFLPDRDIEYLGRIDHQVKIRGFRIELGEIESVLCEHVQIRESFVMAREDIPGVKRLVAYLVSTEKRLDIGEIREHLLKKLPDYMVPAAFLFLDKFPLTNNGKIDRNALPAPEQDRSELVGEFIAPEGPIEEALADIWKRVLRLDTIGAKDNFFELGGDSILSIQIISLARAAGLELSPRLLFKHQSIRELAPFVVPVSSLHKAEQGLVSGTAPLTPIQQWFFEQELVEPYYYNQTFLFYLIQDTDAVLLEQSVSLLEKHHDALRLRFTHDGGAVVQRFSEPSTSAAFQVLDLSQTADDNLSATIETTCARIQAELDYSKGPLWRVCLLNLGENRRERLLIAIHHLAVDGVSWRILLEDLEHAYGELACGEAVKLPEKTTSFKKWSELMSQAATRGKFSVDTDYWLKLIAANQSPIPKDGTNGENTEESAKVITVRLSEKETQALLQQAPARYNTQINDILLTALAQSSARWTGQDHLWVDLEGHGREDIFERVDLSRTVGWFTTIYPMSISLEKGDIGAQIRSVKEQLRSVPHKGLSYGALRYLRSGALPAPALEPEVIFNYLGQFDQVVAESERFHFASESVGPWHSPRARRRHLLEINSMVVNQRLEVKWTYSENRHKSETIQRLADCFSDSLRAIIEHCISTDERTVTPSDFPLAKLSQDKLDALVNRCPDLEDLYPLSPIQTLFHTVGVNDSRKVLDHWHCVLNGKLNVEAFREAWNVLFRRHPILRTSFQSDGLESPLQVVHTTVLPEWSIEDWRTSNAEEQGTKWKDWLNADHEKGIPLDKPLLSRFALLKLSDDRVRFVWTVPALALDGWSWPVFFSELSLVYQAIDSNEEPALGESANYRDYIAWLSSKSDSAAESFWKHRLEGITEPTPLVSGSTNSGSNGKAGGQLEWCAELSYEEVEAFVASTRKLQISPNTLVQAAWAAVMARQCGESNVVFGAAFAGRPTELEGADRIIGPLVNNLPVRISIDKDISIVDFLKKAHADLLQISEHQYVSMDQVQSWSNVPWRFRLFESIVVVQNYAIDESAQRLGDSVQISEFEGPIHSNFPLLALVEPRETWRVKLIFDRSTISVDRAENWGNDFVNAMRTMANEPNKSLNAVLDSMSQPLPRLAKKTIWRAQAQNYAAPSTEVERQISAVWEDMLGVNKISVDQNIFDMGIHSLLVIRLHEKLRSSLNREFPLMNMFQFPTISSLARSFGDSNDRDQSERVQSRASRQRDAMNRMRRAMKRK